MVYSKTRKEVSDRLKETISEAVWSITTGNKLVDGVWLNYDTTSDREIVEYPPPKYVKGNGNILGRLMIIPDEVNGYWMGSVQMLWFDDDKFSYGELEGRGDLAGLKLVFDMRNYAVSENGTSCSKDGWLEFDGYILLPGHKWKLWCNDDDDD